MRAWVQLNAHTVELLVEGWFMVMTLIKPGALAETALGAYHVVGVFF